MFEGAHVPLATLPGMAERTLSISSGGKTFSFTGWKVGWVSGPAPLVAAVRAAKQFLTYTSGAPFQLAIARRARVRAGGDQRPGGGAAGQARPVLRRVGDARTSPCTARPPPTSPPPTSRGGPRAQRARLLPRPAPALRRGGHPQLGLLRPAAGIRARRMRPDPRPLGLLQAGRGAGRGAGPTRLLGPTGRTLDPAISWGDGHPPARGQHVRQPDRG